MSRVLIQVAAGVITQVVQPADVIAAMPYRIGWIDITGVSTVPTVGQAWTVTPPSLPAGMATAIAAGRLRQACDAAIANGFPSSALGAARTYASNSTDQINLATAALASATAPSGWTTSLWCESAGAWAFASHSAAQVQQVMSDWVAFRVAQQTALAAAIAALST